MGGVETKQEVIARLEELDEEEIKINRQIRDIQVKLNDIVPDEERMEVLPIDGPGYVPGRVMQKINIKNYKIKNKNHIRSVDKIRAKNKNILDRGDNENAHFLKLKDNEEEEEEDEEGEEEEDDGEEGGEIDESEGNEDAEDNGEDDEQIDEESGEGDRGDSEPREYYNRNGY